MYHYVYSHTGSLPSSGLLCFWDSLSMMFTVCSGLIDLCQMSAQRSCSLVLGSLEHGIIKAAFSACAAILGSHP